AMRSSCRRLLLRRPAAPDRSATTRRRTLWPTRRRRSGCAASAEACLWQAVEVVRPVANRISVCVQELWRLLKNQRRLHPFGNGCVEDIQPVLMQIDADIGPRLIWIRDLQLVSCHEVDVMEGIKCHFHAGLQPILRGGVLD